jgi:hypothetical protein
VAALKAMYESGVTKPFRFIYMAGDGTERDQTKTPAMMAKYMLMRVSTISPTPNPSSRLLSSPHQGEAENRLLAFAAEHKGEIEVGVPKPGLITSPGLSIRSVFTKAVSMVSSVVAIDRADLVAVMLDQVINGFEKDTLLNADLVRLAKQLSDSSK